MATIKDVAQSAQVSATTVSRVLNRDDNMSVTPEVRMRIFQAAHALGYVSPRQRRAAAEKTKLIIGVADWRIIRPDRPNIRLSSLSCLVQMMTGVRPTSARGRRDRFWRIHRAGDGFSPFSVFRHRVRQF